MVMLKAATHPPRLQAWKHLGQLGVAAAWISRMPGDVVAFLGKCPKCSAGQRRNIVIGRLNDTWEDSGEPVVRRISGDPTVLRSQCTACGAAMFLTKIRGTFNPEVVCNAKCMASKGPNCECSCGGANHGNAYA